MAYPIPPWISQPADTAGQYATGLQIGVRIGAEQAAQRLAQQQLLRQEAQNAFKQQYETAKLALEIDTVTRQQRAVSNYQRDIGMGVSPDQAIMKWGPEFGVDPTSALRVQAMKAQYAQQNQPFNPSIEGVVNPMTGEQVPVLRTGPRSAQMVNKPGLMVRTNPDGTTEIIQGNLSNAEALTKTNQSKVQESQAEALNAIDVANRLEPLISSETVGAKAFAKSWVQDRVLAQFFDGMANPDRATAEELAANLRAAAVRRLRSDSNVTDREVQQILQSIPQINAPLDSPDRARQLIQGIRKMSAIQAIVSSKRMGTKVPKSAAVVLSPDDIYGLWKQGLITEPMAKEAYELSQ